MATTPSGEEFHGVIGRTIAESKPWWPPSKVRPGSPNVVLVVLDDTGFGHLGCYGSTIETPNIDALAAGGLRYTGFHTTALCSPTRASLLTGRNHHSVGMRTISNYDTGFPHMRGGIPRSAATLAEILRENGFATFAAGKWHLAPMAECSAAGPFTHWPLQKGFDRYYGFLQGETDQFSPELTCDNHFVVQPKTAEEGYHFSEDIVDRSVDMIRDVTSLVPERPFFLYLAFGAMHSPHQAPKSYLEKYRGRFDAGWDVVRTQWFERQHAAGIIPSGTKLAPHNPGVKPWKELTRKEQLFACRLQEAFAAMLDHTDHQIGRLVAALRSLDRWENTLFVLLSDNGASQEGGALGVLDEMKWFNGIPQDMDEAVERLDTIGGPNSHSNYPWGWAQTGNTPLKWYKQNTHGGGVRDPLIVHWPKGIGARGELRKQFCHAVDVAPTILDALGIAQPDSVAGVKQMPIHGTSFKASFFDPHFEIARGAQYFEMLGHRGIVEGGWKAVARHTPGQSFQEDRWELYHLSEDFSECVDLAEQEPGKLKELIDRWWQQAEIHGVLPLDDRRPVELFGLSKRTDLPTSRSRFTYFPPVSHIVADACPPSARGWTTEVWVEHPAVGGDGAFMAVGNCNCGFVLYVRKGHVVFDYNAFHQHTEILSPRKLDAGMHKVTLKVERLEDGSADASLAIDENVVARSRIPRLLYILSATGMDIGRSLAPVNGSYVAPFSYPGRISKLVITIPNAMTDGEVEAHVRAEMTRQ